MTSKLIKPNSAYMQLLKDGTLGNRSNVWVVCQKIGGEVGNFHTIGNTKKPQAFKSLARAIKAWRKHSQSDGERGRWVVINSDELARCELIWLQ